MVQGRSRLHHILETGHPLRHHGAGGLNKSQEDDNVLVEHRNVLLGEHPHQVMNLLGGRVGLGNLYSDQIMFMGIGTPQTFFSNLITPLLVPETKDLVLRMPYQ